MLKFRVWDKTLGEFIWLDKSNLVTNIYPRISSEISVAPHQIVEQYTGLLDKNGKEIYEGDLVQKHWKYCDGSYESKIDKPIAVVFKDSCFKTGAVSLGAWNDVVLEVVGNIHETKHE